MDQNTRLIQTPAPGTRMLMFCGDTLSFSLALSHPQKGAAWVRTNMGHAKIARHEIVREVELDETPLGRAWFDIPMHRVDDQTFKVMLPLREVGHFEAKCFFLKKGEVQPAWPEGENSVVNVEPAHACCANTIYNAFVRQFGPNKTGTKILEPSEQDYVQGLDKAGYTVIPPSGTFRDLIAELDFIIGELGCRILLLLPIHPTPTTYGRMGRFGSPYAALSFTAVDPALAEFDLHATPLEQFIELVDAVHQLSARIFIDIAINHTGWAAGLHETHPHWLVRSPEGRIEVPGAWGVAWEDLTKLDYSRKDLWRYIADVFIKWCHRGVDGFRCDAGYMIPIPAWKYIVAKVREQYPDTIFLLEGLGGKISVTRELLNRANFNWAYSELFQNYNREEIENYLPQAIDISKCDGLAVHFVETHDNPRLAARSKAYAQMRTALCALCSDQGAFGFTNGVEWYATEKIDVHDAPSLNWGAKSNQVEQIRRICHLLKVHPAFHEGSELKLVPQNEGNFVVLLRHHVVSGKKLLVLVNLDHENKTLASWNPALTGLEEPLFVDLFTGEKVRAPESNGLFTYPLDPGQVLCLSSDIKDLELVKLPDQPLLLPERIEEQRLRAKALQVFSFYHGTEDIGDFDLTRAARELKEDPIAFCKGLTPSGQETRVITWQWPRDLGREVMIPSGHFLLVRADFPFRARIMDRNRAVASEESLPGLRGSFFSLVSPLKGPKTGQSYTLKLSVYYPEICRHEEAALYALPRPEDVRIKRIFRRPELFDNKNLVFLGTNGRGGMLRIPVSWTRLTSRYDCLLAANMSPEYPEDRWIMFTRCRAWLVFQGYSQEINTNCLEACWIDDFSKGHWQYQIPTGQGEHVIITVRVEMAAHENAVGLSFLRHPAKLHDGRLADSKPVGLILRPDIENRSFHHTTKAYTGPEHRWPQSVAPQSSGFTFSPDADHHLRMQISKGQFVREPEWQYMVNQITDAVRGQDPDSDLFSPGYFHAFLKGNQEVTLSAEVTQKEEHALFDFMTTNDPIEPFEPKAGKWREPLEALKTSLSQYVVKRGDLKTVIAGYPWFLDWGRDALIFVRGLIASGKIEVARAILKQFGRFEVQGTLPNMIHGDNADNRDTSDAPLWFTLACADLIGAEETDEFLDRDCGGRPVRRVLLSIGQSIIAGTPNGIRMDPESGLVFSPAHFSWMDTNHPAGTPREGYPIEIQALWYAALVFLSKIDIEEKKKDWENLSRQVQASIMTCFWQDDLKYLSDCLHAESGQPVKMAVADDALRPNQLLALTLGAVKDAYICQKVLAACEELLVPGAIRSLADRPVSNPIKIVHQGKVINDPHHPYQGKYMGDEDTQRKPAYHNGTAWTWLFPSFCEAWSTTYGKEGRETALSWLLSGVRHLEQGCLGHIPEILDGDYPHRQRGCDAQAWGSSELLRVWLKLGSNIDRA